jgi:hypothetical protein
MFRAMQAARPSLGSSVSWKEIDWILLWHKGLRTSAWFDEATVFESMQDLQERTTYWWMIPPPERFA